jgi:hypothetical protein
MFVRRLMIDEEKIMIPIFMYDMMKTWFGNTGR